MVTSSGEFDWQSFLDLLCLDILLPGAEIDSSGCDKVKEILSCWSSGLLAVNRKDENAYFSKTSNSG